MPRLHRSAGWNVKNGESEISDYRTSQHMCFRLGEGDVVSSIEQKIADLTHVPIENGEGLQVVRYSEGDITKVIGIISILTGLATNPY
jgi:prolyl 4-hydroxylase